MGYREAPWRPASNSLESAAFTWKVPPVGGCPASLLPCPSLRLPFPAHPASSFLCQKLSYFIHLKQSRAAWK